MTDTVLYFKKARQENYRVSNKELATILSDFIVTPKGGRFPQGGT
jgi:hypothetical protein